MAIRILIVDDHGVLRAGLRSLLGSEPDLTVVGEACTGEEALTLAASLHPDIVLLDLNMPGMSGAEVMRRMCRLHPEPRVLVLTVYEDEDMLRELIHAGAGGFIVKRAVESELISAIRSVARGDLYIYPSLTRALLPRARRSSRHARPAPQTLTPRETDVLGRIVDGYTNRQTADELGLSVRTVETHRANLMGKLGLKSRVELVRWAATRRNSE